MPITDDEQYDQLHPLDTEWILERLPKSVYALLKDKGTNLVLAGGFIRSVIAREEINDIDLFSPDHIHAKSASDKFAQWHGVKPYVSENAYSINIPDTGMQVQFIHRWGYPDARTLIKSFDFTIGQAAVWIPVTHPPFSVCAKTYYQDLAAKRLVYTNPTREEAAGGSMLRLLKFLDRGYRIPLDSLADMIARISQAAELVKQNSENPSSLSTRILGLLHEVDPHIDPAKSVYIPRHRRNEVDMDHAGSGIETFGWAPERPDIEIAQAVQ